MLRAIKAELLKLKGASVPLWTALAVALFPLMSLLSVNLTDPGLEHATWEEFMRGAPQNIASWYGILLFGLATAHVFGREYSDGTAKDMLTLPIRREHTVAAKMTVIAAWVLALAALSVTAQALFAAAFGLQRFAWQHISTALADSAQVSLLIYFTLPIVALLAMIGGGYLAPMLFSALAAAAGLTFAQVGWETWFPWSMPVAVVGSAIGMPVGLDQLTPASWAIAATFFVVGLAAVIWYVDHADTQ